MNVFNNTEKMSTELKEVFRRQRADIFLSFIRKQKKEVQLGKTRNDSFATPLPVCPYYNRFSHEVDNILASLLSQEFYTGTILDSIRKVVTECHCAEICSKVATCVPLMETVVRFLSMQEADADTTKAHVILILHHLTAVNTVPEIFESIEYSGIIGPLMEALKSKNPTVLLFATSTMGNYMAYSTENRDKAVRAGIIRLLEDLYKKFTLDDTLKAALSWALFAVCGDCSKSGELLVHIFECLVPLSCLILTDDEEILGYTCWSLSYLCDDEYPETKERVDRVMHSGVGPRLIQLLEHTSPAVVDSALNLVAKIVCSSEENAQRLIEMGVIYPLIELLHNCAEENIKAAVGVLSNISAGTEAQIADLVEAGVIPQLASIMIDVPSLKSFRIEVLRSFTHLSRSRIWSHTQQMLDHGVLKIFCQNLSVLDNDAANIALKGIHRVLQQANRAGSVQLRIVKTMIEDYGAIDGMENLYSESNNELFDQVNSILQEYFDLSDIFEECHE